MTTMFDVVDPAKAPPSGDIYAGYIDGRYRSAGPLFARFPNAKHVTITVLGTAGAVVADCEPGDLTPQSAAAWARREVDAGRRPTIYCSTASRAVVTDALSGQGLRLGIDVDWWEAHYDNTPSLTPGSVAKQYASTNDYDTSVTNGSWPGRNVMPEHQPPYVFEPVVADCGWPGGGALMVAADGSVYAVGGAPFYGGPNENQDGENWKGGNREAASIVADLDGKGYTVTDTAGEEYTYRAPGA